MIKMRVFLLLIFFDLVEAVMKARYNRPLSIKVSKLLFVLAILRGAYILLKFNYLYKCGRWLQLG